MVIRVLYFQWGAGLESGDLVFAGGDHGPDDLPKTAEWFRLVAGAEAAGVLEVVEADDDERAKLDRHVQSQDDGEKAYDKASQSDEWRRANLEQHVLSKEDQLAYDKTLDDDHPDKLTPEKRSLVLIHRDQSKAALAEMDAAEPDEKKKGGRG